jgi:hypothetical protein
MSLRTVSDADLADRYLEAARRRGEALGVGDSDRANREFDELTAIYREFKRRGMGAFDTLIASSHDRDPNVRAAVGWALIELFPEKARAILTDVATQLGLPGFSAEMTLREWENGHLKFPDAAD